MTNGSTELTPPEVTADDVLRVPDDHFTTDTVAIVTGGGSGIGQATSVALAINGLTVAAVDIDAEGLEETVDVATALDAEGRVVPVEGDLADDDAVEAAVDDAADLGTIRYTANIDGMQHIASLADFPMETYDFMHDLMLRSPFLLSKLVIPHIEATDDGVGAIGNI
ncbi:SDR family NAD(P)-dependent oxidoreductase (plasmid) [Natronorubrum bangense]|uniref:Short-chain dehydrogenase/reductase SDR n=2 Tax=Natronorubrum bangense TaxID=61858 RepID=L9WAY4_9EURY|nr:SDR family oxidoreductase [Natronorubrum bangense]ELY46507.1 hypothetical protein C494_14348 [Natronorubrum bangense JCM 10635]QCC56343.1 SDR family NAD(P)-dependent oxidoreductase [Natronorubrum bangense]